MKIIQIINNALKHTLKLPKKRSYFYVSDAAKTPYQLFKSMAGITQINPRTRRLMENGNDVHKRYIRYLEKAGVVKATEVAVRNRLFSGRADAVVFVDGKLCVLEIKSMNSENFSKLKKYGTRQAYLQLQLYMHFLGIDDGIILAICSDDQRMKEFYIRRKYRVAKEIMEKFYKIKQKFVAAGVMAK